MATNFIDTVLGVWKRYTDPTALKKETEQANRVVVVVEHPRTRVYVYNSGSLQAPDGISVIIPESYSSGDPGRWILEGSVGLSWDYFANALAAHLGYDLCADNDPACVTTEITTHLGFPPCHGVNSQGWGASGCIHDALLDHLGFDPCP